MTQPAENETVLALFNECDALLQGHFKLTSGKHSEWYFEKIRLIEKPAALEKSSTCWPPRSGARSRVSTPSSPPPTAPVFSGITAGAIKG